MTSQGIGLFPGLGVEVVQVFGQAKTVRELGKRAERDIEKATILFASSLGRTLRNVCGDGECGPAGLGNKAIQFSLGPGGRY